MAAEHALAMGGRLLRRYCSCASAEPCSCGLKRAKSGWTVPALARLQQLMSEHRSIAVIAPMLGRTHHDCSRALDVLTCRTPTQALAMLEAQSTRTKREAARAKRWALLEWAEQDLSAENAEVPA